VIAVTERRPSVRYPLAIDPKRQGDHAMMKDQTTQAEPVELMRAKRDEPAELAEQQLAEVAGGFLVFTFKLVAVKTVSWAHD
jgi:hypothetical protein